MDILLNEERLIDTLVLELEELEMGVFVEHYEQGCSFLDHSIQNFEEQITLLTWYALDRNRIHTVMKGNHRVW